MPLGGYHDNPAEGGSSEWTDTGTVLHPSDLSGAEDVVIGGTTTGNSDIVLHGEATTPGGAVFNEQGNAVDFRVEGDTDTELLFVDGSADNVGISTTTPSAKLDVQGTMLVENNTSFSSVNSQTTNYALVVDGPTTNYVTNPSFEVDTAGWTATGGSTITRTVGFGIFGNAGLKVDCAALASVGTETTVTSIPAGVKMFSFYARGVAGGEVIKVRVNTSDILSNITLTTDWQRYAAEFTNTGSVDLKIVSQTTGAPSFYIDGIQAEVTGPANFPTTYCDGSLGLNYSWSGTAHASTSSRSGFMHFLNDIDSNVSRGFHINQDGTIGGAGLTLQSDLGSEQDYQAHFKLKSKHNTSNFQNENAGTSATVLIQNEGNGAALVVKGSVTGSTNPLLWSGEAVMLVSGESVTEGSILSVVGPEDPTTMEANGGFFLRFSDKSDADHLSMSVNTLGLGAENLHYKKQQFVFGGGNWKPFEEGTVGTTVTNSAGSPTLTGTGTKWNTPANADYVQAGHCIFMNDPDEYAVILRVDSDTQLTMNANITNAHSSDTWAHADPQYMPGIIAFESSGENNNVASQGRHTAASGDTTVQSLFPSYASDFFSSMWADKDGLFRRYKGASVGGASSYPTTDTDGDVILEQTNTFSDNAVPRGDTTNSTNQLQNSSVLIDDSDNMSGLGYVEVSEIAAPATPSSGNVRIYAKTDNKLYIKDDTGTETDLTSGGGGGGGGSTDLLNRDLTSEGPSNTTAWTQVYSYSVPGGTLGTTNILETQMSGQIKNATGAVRWFQFRVTYGSTVITANTCDMNQDTETGAWWGNVILVANGATNAQKITICATSAEADTGGSTNDAKGTFGYGTASEDSTTAKTLLVEARWEVANANIELKKEIAYTKKI